MRPSIARSVFFESQRREQVSLSPDGLKIAFTDSRSLSGGVTVLTLGQRYEILYEKTLAHGRTVSRYWWTADSRSMLISEDPAGREHFGVLKAEIESGNEIGLVSFPDKIASIVSSGRLNDHYILVSINYDTPSVFDVYQVDLISRDMKLVTKNPGNVVRWYANDQMEIAAAKAMYPGGRSDILVRVDAKSSWKILTSCDLANTFEEVIGFDPTSSSVYLATNATSNYIRLVKKDVNTSKETLIFESEEGDIDDVLFDSNNERLLAARTVANVGRWHVVDSGARSLFHTIESFGGDSRVVSRDRTDKTWLVKTEFDYRPALYRIVDRESGASVKLFSSQPRLDCCSLSSVRSVTFSARDGMQINAYLARPSARAKRLPLLVLVHGGPWERDYWQFNPEVQWLANRGYEVLQVNFRGSSGFGKKYLSAGNRQWGRAMQDDLVDGVRWVVEHEKVDPSRVGIFGASYGGYAALLACQQEPSTFACGVAISAPTNLVTMIDSLPTSWGSARQIYLTRVGDTATDSEVLLENSPIVHAAGLRRPLLIAHGSNDPRVKLEESDTLVSAIQSHGGTVEYLVFDGEGHTIRGPENRRRLYDRIELFLSEHLGGVFEGPAVSGSA